MTIMPMYQEETRDILCAFLQKRTNLQLIICKFDYILHTMNHRKLHEELISFSDIQCEKTIGMKCLLTGTCQ